MNNFLGLGIGFGRFIVILICAYFIIKWAVKNGIEEAYRDITGKETYEDKEAKKLLGEYADGFDETKKRKKKNNK